MNTTNNANCDNSIFCDGVETCDPLLDCQIDQNPPTGQVCGENDTGICIDLGCVFDGMITIVKMADPNDGTDFLFSCTDSSQEACNEIGGDNAGMFTLDDVDPDDGDEFTDMITFPDVLAGTYMIQEMLPSGWGIIWISCDDPDDETLFDLDTVEAVVDLDPGEEISCTFWNELLCGNGALDEGEECDDGNRIDGDFCSSTCNYEDLDGDGVIDIDDECLDTPGGEIVDPDNGCSINDLCPCEGGWKNHGKYVSCVAKSAENFLYQGLITEAEKDAIVSEAAHTSCGKKK